MLRSSSRLAWVQSRLSFPKLPRISVAGRAALTVAPTVILLPRLPFFQTLKLESHPNLPHIETPRPLRKRISEPVQGPTLLELIWDDLPAYLIAIVLAFASSSLSVYIPSAVGKLIDALKNQESVAAAAAQMAGTFAVHATLQAFSITAITYAAERLGARLKTMLFSAFIEQEVAYYDANSSAVMVERISSDVQEIKSASKKLIVTGVRHLTQIVGGLLSLFFISPKLTGALLCVVPPIVAVGAGFGAFLRSLSAQVRAAQAQASASAQDALANIRTVKAFTNEEWEKKEFEGHARSVAWLSLKFGIAMGIFTAATTIGLNGLGLAGYAFGGTLVNRGEISPGDLTSFLLYATNLQHSLGQLSVLAGTLSKASLALQKISQIMGETRAQLANKEGLEPESVLGHINLQAVDFAYPTRPDSQVLRKFSLDLPAGKVMALVGPTGEGKSTVAALIEKFYTPAEGTITLDGIPLNELNVPWLRRQIGIVTQDPVMFQASIYDNIRYGRPDASAEEIMEAARRAQCHEFITGFPDGYQTLVGERGTTLSGGQKQRISIARAILKDPKILILDEATSALDNASEKLVQAALDEVMAGRTVLVIAHRLSTIKRAHCIAVIKSGQVAESGSHEELERKNGDYAKLLNASKV